MSLFAQTLPDPNSAVAIGWVLVVIIALASGALVFKQLFSRTPALHREFASREELDALTAKVEGVTTKIEEGFTRLDQKRSTSIAGLHEVVREQGAQVAALRADTDSQTRQLHLLDGKIEHLPEKILAILRR